MITDLQQFIEILRAEGELQTISVPVQSKLEAAEIHRRVIAAGGPAILFQSIDGAALPLVTNLFGTKRRVELAFGKRPEELVRAIARFPYTLLPPTIGNVWRERATLLQLAKVGLKRNCRDAPVTEVVHTPPRLTQLPLLKTWEEDGGEFVTLPLVLTEHPVTGIPNLGMYRIQRYDDETTGFHCQIGKGAGYHLAAARDLNRPLPVNIFIGGPPALILAAIAPLPENVPELLLASLVMGKRLELARNPSGPLPLVARAEIALVGEVSPTELRAEGPFGDHYGYYSLKHDYPVFRCRAMYHRANAVCAATVVGKPRQEDFYIGDYLQDLLSPLFPLVMPTVRDLWSYGETGYHSLAAAVVQQRYKREAMVSAFRILGEGQLALTKFLLVVDRPQDLHNFKTVLEYVLARADFRSDLYVFSNLAMDTLDYTGPKVNEGSKGVLLGVGEPIRELPGEFVGEVPRGVRQAVPYCRGCLVVSGPPFSEDPHFSAVVAAADGLATWPLIVLVDDAETVAASDALFLWTTFTRFEPAQDILARGRTIVRNHLSYEGPIVIDARMKPHYPAELECDRATKALVDRRWKEYGLRGI